VEDLVPPLALELLLELEALVVVVPQVLQVPEQLTKVLQELGLVRMDLVEVEVPHLWVAVPLHLAQVELVVQVSVLQLLAQRVLELEVEAVEVTPLVHQTH
jgi:hypothetical protein